MRKPTKHQGFLIFCLHKFWNAWTRCSLFVKNIFHFFIAIGQYKILLNSRCGSNNLYMLFHASWKEIFHWFRIKRTIFSKIYNRSSINKYPLKICYYLSTPLHIYPHSTYFSFMSDVPDSPFTPWIIWMEWFDFLLQELHKYIRWRLPKLLSARSSAVRDRQDITAPLKTIRKPIIGSVKLLYTE